MLVNRIHGGLAMSAVGDAFGSATETMSRRTVAQTYGWLDELVAPEHSPFSAGMPAGSITDDSSLLIALADAIARHGSVSREIAESALIDWADDPRYYERFVGPSTRAAVDRIRRGERAVPEGLLPPGIGVSNGAAMKIAPIGWACAGLPDRAVRIAVESALVTHPTGVAAAGAAAVAAAGGSIVEVTEAAISGASAGESLALSTGARDVPSPSVTQRIRLAVDLVSSAASDDEALDRLYGIVGAGLHTAEAVPSALALLTRADGDLRRLCVLAANLGDDSDTVGCIAAAIAGTIGGFDAVPADWWATVAEVNKLSLLETARGVAAVALREGGTS